MTFARVLEGGIVVGIGTIVSLLEHEYPGTRVGIVGESNPSGYYELVYIDGVVPDQAEKCCASAWVLAANTFKIRKFAVLARDTNGEYWGLDASHFRAPKAVFESWGPYDRRDPFQVTMKQSGTGVVGQDGMFYQIRHAVPWGPTPERKPVEAL